MHSSVKSLLAALARRIGRAQAEQEYSWMKQAQSHANSDLAAMIRRRLVGEPLQYILGTQPFGPLNLLTSPPVLIPRPETEDWVFKLSDYISPTTQVPRRLLDLGTGSGCIPLLLCHLWPAGSVRAIGIDTSHHAIQLANENATLCGLAVSHDDSCEQNSFRIFRADMLDPKLHENPNIKLPIDIVTSNPPYVTWHDYLRLPRSVSAFEDPKALFGGPSGLEFYHAIAQFIGREGVLSSDAIVALEVGDGQAKNVECLIQQTGRIRCTKIWMDPWGKERVVIGHAV
ncbi:hypothetical protein AX17_004002 [Amanita inopinata Kibby_2008]|nr:hypothetical protein AX17_004002 [Amanita inopinata Kibby_2008]